MMSSRTCFFLCVTTFWFFSCSVDSPTGPGENPDIVYNLLINEVDLNVPDAIEIYNSGTESVDLDGWTLKAGDNVRVQRFILPSRVIAPGEYLLLIEGTEASNDSALFLGESTSGLTNINWSTATAGAVELLNKENTTIDYVEWGVYPEMNARPEDWSGTPISLPPPGSTVGRDIKSTDTNLSEDIIPLINTPGRVNDSHPIILTRSLKDGVIGSDYEDRIVVAGPAEPFTFELESGDLPEGLSLESDGTVKGILTKAGVFSFNIRVLDSQTPPKPALATISVSSLAVDITFEKNALLVNGVHWSTYNDEIFEAYRAKAFWGNVSVDFWDVFNEPAGGYPRSLPAPVGHGEVPMKVLAEYSSVIWIGNNFNGDLQYWRDSPVLDYVKFGGNLLLMTRNARSFVDEEFREYLGIVWAENASRGIWIRNCISTFSGLISIPVNSPHSFVDLFQTNMVDNESTLLFKESITFFRERGLGVWKKPADGGDFREDGGQIVLLGVRPYRVNSLHLRQNVEYILRRLFGSV